MKLGITGSPTPIVIWAKEGKPIPRARTSNTHDYTTLELPKADHGDTGNYVVNVENEHGRDSADIPVIVIDKPGPPEGPLEVSDAFADSCQLSWKPPQDKGNSPIIGYTVKKCKEGSDFWEKVPGMPMCKSIIVTGLKTGVKFKFRVMAENIYGIGEPLETDFPVLVKNRFEPPYQEDSNSEEDSEEDSQLLIQLLCPQLQPTSPKLQPASPKPQPASPKFQPNQQPALSERKRRKEKCGLLKNKLLLSDNSENIFTLQSCQVNTRLRRAEKKNLYC